MVIRQISGVNDSCTTLTIPLHDSDVPSGSSCPIALEEEPRHFARFDRRVSSTVGTGIAGDDLRRVLRPGPNRFSTRH